MSSDGNAASYRAALDRANAGDLTGVSRPLLDGKCVERGSTADMLGLLIQVGAVPPPGA